MKMSKLLLGLSIVPLMGVISACGGSGEDSTKTILRVYNYNGGFGTEWLTKAVKRYEAVNAERSFEDGKVGVQVKITPTKDIPNTPQGFLSNKNEVFFTENLNYNEFVANGVLYDITSALTSDNPYEPGKTIESKLTNQQKDGYKINGTKYYGIPHYGTTYGITYDIKLFEDRCFYLAKNYTPADPFVYDLSDPRTAGPDGIEGTYDDGLPATFEEFYLLCDQMVKDDVIPLSWTGQYADQYTSHMLANLTSNIEGYDNCKQRFSFDGTIDDAVKLNNGTFDFSQTESVSLNGSTNGYDVFRQKSVYEGLKFFRHIIDNKAWYANGNDGKGTKCFNSSVSHVEAQSMFINGATVNGKQKSIGMLVEGTWWQNEAKEIFNESGKKMDEVKYGWLPLPKPDSSYAAGNTYVDTQNSFGVVSKNIAPEKVAVALDFLQFVNTDESLVEYTLTTNTFKNLNYSLTDEQVNSLTPFGKSLVYFKQNASPVMTASQNEFFTKNESALMDMKEMFSNKYAGYPARQFYQDSSLTAEKYFQDMYGYYKDTIWKTKIHKD